jgi:hypothetical protein
MEGETWDAFEGFLTGRECSHVRVLDAGHLAINGIAGSARRRIPRHVIEDLLHSRCMWEDRTESGVNFVNRVTRLGDRHRVDLDRGLA